jgi:hypothetical protein
MNPNRWAEAAGSYEALTVIKKEQVLEPSLCLAKTKERKCLNLSGRVKGAVHKAKAWC